ncbi:flagellar biosynthesis regulator FlaF [Mariluticola halotolerans]|uniref:flagellar biosynthesis regulator FlaF n=1 Tax=Mariluticola halotolerans TaxID=2909283 RepID=UPI0026E470C5|nr:flagellar biosynthesis regulator FlaF [Mariluticola halotolerans]UJQ95430.1 flagellar biosynthesis regulator FlaF [Mariluticola halotolerans]
MQHQAAQAYQQVARNTVSPRDLEANLLSKSAASLQRIRDNWDEERGGLGDALLYNRKLWTLFVESVTKDDNPLPEAIRQNVANLGLFVLKQTVETQLEPDAQKLNSLININREVAAGLRGNSGAE